MATAFPRHPVIDTRVEYNKAVYFFHIEPGLCIIKAIYPHSIEVQHPVLIPADVACQAIREVFSQAKR